MPSTRHAVPPAMLASSLRAGAAVPARTQITPAERIEPELRRIQRQLGVERFAIGQLDVAEAARQPALSLPAVGDHARGGEYLARARSTTPMFHMLPAVAAARARADTSPNAAR